MSDRYLKWLGSNFIKNISLIDLLPVVFFLFAVLGNFNLLYFALILSYPALFWLHKAKEEKKKLVYTSRVRRLIITVSIIFALCFLYVQYEYLSLYANIWFLSAALLFTQFTFVVVLLAHIINLPVEKVIQNYYYRDARKMMRNSSNLKVIGVTGSYGKTSTKYFLRKILSEKYNVLMTPESYNTLMGVTVTIRKMLRPIHDIFIVEMGAKNPGDIKEICDLVKPSAGVLTSIGEQHLETFRSLQNVQRTKFELIDSLPPDGYAFLNMDDQNISSFDRPGGAKYIFFGIHAEGLNYWVEDIKVDAGGSSFLLVKDDGRKIRCQTKLLGQHNIYNILAAASVAAELGVDFEKIAYAIKRLEPIPHRLELRYRDNVTIIDDAFNANPVGAKMALEVLAQINGTRKIIITPGIVELGAQDYDINYNLGIEISKVCDYIILVGPKRTKPIQDALIKAGCPQDKYFVAGSLTEAVAQMNKIAEQGSVILFENDLPDNYNE
jgi:UDP-N-acetylmuramoyl-tripeptide--D-alanyl-D-alanine ligase